MSISRERFDYALSKMRSSDWQRFEQLSSAFMASEFSGLRTMASPGGDGGRDAELYSFDTAPKVMLQYSVQETWRDKISKTLKRLQETFPDTGALIFLSNQEIGAQGDDMVTALRNKGIHLDIRDKTWFLDRMNLDDNRRESATELARAIVDPLLTDKGVIKSTSALVGQEAKTALVFLELQALDEDSSKGITKSCFESLVKAALQGTNSSSRMTKEEIHSRVQSFLPRHSPSQLYQFIDSALARMSKNVIKRHPDNTYNISHDEREKTKDRVAHLAVLGEAFKEDVSDITADFHGNNEELREQIADLVRKVIELYLYRIGEEFAQSLANDRDIPLHQDLLKNSVIEIAPRGKALDGELWIDYLYRITLTTLSTPSKNTTALFKVMSTGYTLFAFLEEVPDVQKVTKKLFSHATLWLDTTVLLPVIAEQAFGADDRPFTQMLLQLNRSGLKTVFTSGILEEVERHLSLSRMFTIKKQDWEGRVPYVYQR